MVQQQPTYHGGLNDHAKNPNESAFFEVQRNAQTANKVNNGMQGGRKQARHYKGRLTKRQQGGNDALTKNIEQTTNTLNQSRADAVHDGGGSRRRMRSNKRMRRNKRMRSNKRMRRNKSMRSNKKRQRISRKKRSRKSHYRVCKTHKGGRRNKNGGYPAHNWGCYS